MPTRYGHRTHKQQMIKPSSDQHRYPSHLKLVELMFSYNKRGKRAYGHGLHLDFSGAVPLLGVRVNTHSQVLHTAYETMGNAN